MRCITNTEKAPVSVFVTYGNRGNFVHFIQGGYFEILYALVPFWQTFKNGARCRFLHSEAVRGTARG